MLQPEQVVGCGVEQGPKLFGQEAVAAQAVGLEVQLQLLEAVFQLAPQYVYLIIDALGRRLRLVTTKRRLAPKWPYPTLATIRRGRS